MRRVVIESPYVGARTVNVRYLCACLRHSLLLGESPIASHWCGVLDDSDPEEHRIGVTAGLSWQHVAHAVIVYTDLGISPRMSEAIRYAETAGVPVEFRNLPVWDADPLPDETTPEACNPEPEPL